MIRLKRYLTVFLLFGNLFLASAQQRVWDDALDWYSHVSAKCSDWRERIDRGESVPRDSLQLMLGELSAVRQELQRAWKDMSPRQRRCFEAIRDRFLTGAWPVDALPSTAPAVSIPVRVDNWNASRARFGVNAAGKMPFWAENGAALTAGTPSEADFVSTRQAPQSPRHAPHPLPQSLQPPQALQSPHVAQPPQALQSPPRLAPVAGLVAGAYPDFSMGALLGMSIGPDWAVFVMGRSNFRQRRASYDCLSDGTAGEGFFWGGGEKDVNRHQLTLDVSYALSRPVRLYAGAGYGIRTLCWKDADGAWARVADRSVHGLAFDAGLVILPFRGTGPSILVGAGFLPGGGYVDAVAGFSWWF